MAQIYTHYDNLKVARNAPSEVIRAAYKTLSQKYHPDRNPGNADAVRIMAIINTSYEILSDPNKRQDHDLWIAQQELGSAQKGNVNSQPKPTTRQAPTPRLRIGVGDVVDHILRYWVLYGFACVMLWLWAIGKPYTPPQGPKPYQSTPPPSQIPYQAIPAPVKPAAYVRPNTAPNGQPWPVSASYVKGYQQLHTTGLSTVTVDNSQNDSDVFVKLVSLASDQAYPVRQFYIPAFGRFTLNKVTAGSYDVRYRDISNGGLSRTEAFNLEETVTNEGTQFSNITLTLYKVQNGNMQTYGLSESEF